jgi:hypothetical protein
MRLIYFRSKLCTKGLRRLDEKNRFRSMYKMKVIQAMMGAAITL